MILDVYPSRHPLFIEYLSIVLSLLNVQLAQFTQLSYGVGSCCAHSTDQKTEAHNGQVMCPSLQG